MANGEHFAVPTLRIPRSRPPNYPESSAPSPPAAATLSSPSDRRPLRPARPFLPDSPPPGSGVGPSAPSASPSSELIPASPVPGSSVRPQLKFTMSGMPSDEATGHVRLEGDVSAEKVEDTQNQNEVSGMPSRQQEEAVIKKKYGGILPRKTPLISKDHERAYFDSADWALGKQGGVPNKPKGPLEALRPKLQPTQQNARARRTSYASADNEECLNLPAEDLGQDAGESIDDKNKE